MSSSNLTIQVKVKLKFKKLCTREQFGSVCICSIFETVRSPPGKWPDEIHQPFTGWNSAAIWRRTSVHQMEYPSHVKAIFGGKVQDLKNLLSSKKVSSFIWYANGFSIESTGNSLSWLLPLYEIRNVLKIGCTHVEFAKKMASNVKISTKSIWTFKLKHFQ